MSWLIKLAAYYCQSLLITGRVDCPIIKVDWLTAGVFLRELVHCLQVLTANEKLGLEADKISQTLLKKATGTPNNGGAWETICQDSLAGCWCAADLGWLNIGQLQVPAPVPQAKH